MTPRDDDRTAPPSTSSVRPVSSQQPVARVEKSLTPAAGGAPARPEELTPVARLSLNPATPKLQTPREAGRTVEVKAPAPAAPPAVKLSLREVPQESGRVPHKAQPAGFAEASHEQLPPIIVSENKVAPAVEVVVMDTGPAEAPSAASAPAEAPSAASASSSPAVPMPAGPATLAVRTPAEPTLAPPRPGTLQWGPSPATALQAAARGPAVPEAPDPAGPGAVAPGLRTPEVASTHAIVMPGPSIHAPVQIPATEGVRAADVRVPTLAPRPAVSSPISPPGAIAREPAPALAPAPAAPAPRVAMLEAAPAKPPAPTLPPPVAERESEPAKPAAPTAASPVAEAKPAPVPADDLAPPPAPPVKPQPPAPVVDTRPKSVDMLRPMAEITQIGPFEVRGHVEEMKVVLRRSKLMRTKVDLYRVSVVDPSVCDVTQYTPREIAIVGKSQGATDVTFWFADERHEPLTYLVRVVPDPEVQERREEQYGILEDVLAELFPESKVKLVPVADKLLVKGQARDAEEAAQIMAIIRGQAVYPRYGAGYGMVQGPAVSPLAQEDGTRGLPASQVINMLHIPGVQQVALKVKVAELSRSAARNFGVDLDMNFVWSEGAIAIRQILNLASGTGVVSGTFDRTNINFGIHYLESKGVVRMISEPTLVTLSGRPATFLAGGEFAVPTTVGVAGASAVTTDFRAYGAIVTFLPVVLDKDFIRLEVAPEFSKINRQNSVGGTPGLDTRSVTTTVEMREGQTLAIAGLLDDSMKGNNATNIPVVGQIFGKRGMTRNETELIILVTPELVHPMEPEAVPPLPGFDVTEPTNWEFFLQGRLEGRPTHEYRSTVWPNLRRRYQAGGPAMISGPFGHGD